MRKVKLIIHETYQGKRKSEDVFAAVFLSDTAALTPNTRSGIIKDTERSLDCGGNVTTSCDTIWVETGGKIDAKQ